MSGAVSAKAKSLGIVTAIWGGSTTLNVETKGSTFSPGGLQFMPVISGVQVGASQSMVEAKAKGSFPLTEGMSLDALRALSGKELQLECDTGQTYIIAQAFIKGDIGLKGGAGSNVTIEWFGPPASEVMS